ncbi:MAG: TetR/AcrR family transcriptional regulator [Halioglobus sp.]|nr:TetR/AcrR family transcriptional regulator [Halioglobus sp.]
MDQNSSMPPPQPRKRPTQSRSRLVFDSIQQACLQILVEEGADAVTTNRIAEVAGINIASLYQYFPNKEAIIALIFKEYVRNYADTVFDQLEPFRRQAEDSLEETLETIIAMRTDSVYGLYQLNPPFFKEYCRHFDILMYINEHTQRLGNPSWEEWFEQFMQLHRHRLRSGDLTTLSFVARSMLDGCIQTVMYSTPEKLSDDAFRKELYYALRNYLVTQ